MKKSLSILLALLMILSSLPIMTIGAAAEAAEDPNVLASYKAADWGVWRWDSISDNTSIAKGDGTSDFRVAFPGSQNIFTTVTLEPNTNYTLSFDWYSKNIDGGKSYPTKIDVFPVEEGVNVFDITQYKVFDDTNYNTATEEDLALFEKCVWYEGIMPTGYGTTAAPDGQRYNGYLPDIYDNDYGTDLVTSETHGESTVETWQNSTAKITTGEYTNYIIIIGFGTAGGDITKQELYLADFDLSNPAIASAATPIEEKTAKHWVTWQHSKIYDDTSIAHGEGTSELRVDKPVYQNFATVVTLEPNTTYDLSFDWYAVSHSAGNPQIVGIYVYPAESGDIFSSDAWILEGGYNLPAGYTDLETQNGGYGTAVDAWQTAKTTFTTTESTKYNIIFNGNSTGGFNNEQKIYLANFSLKPDYNILTNATYANGSVTWTTQTNVDERIGTVDAWGGSWNDNTSVSYNGGYSWAFGFGDGKVGGDNNYTDDMYKETFGYVYIKANGLKADATYDFSFINRFLFKFMPYSIAFADGTNAVTSYLEGPTTEILSDSYSEKTSLLFKVPVDGDYVITLRGNRANTVTNQSWNMNGLSQYGATVLCDLELYKKGAMYNVSVSNDGYGAASADKTGYVEEGTDVTFTARPETFERFLGWYVGDELVSKDLTYTATVEGDLNVVAKFTKNSENLMADYSVANGNFATMYWGSVSNSTVSRYGGNAVLASDAPHQRFVTKVNLEAGKEYTFSFEWKSAGNIYNNMFPNDIEVVKINDGKNILDKANWNDSCVYSGAVGADIEAGNAYGSQDIANTCEWQNITTTLNPTEAGEYGIIIYMTFEKQDLGEGLKHYNNKQSIYYSDFVLKSEPVIEYTGTKYNWNGVHWSEVSDSADTLDGGYAYKVAKAMSQNINTTLTLKPGTKYSYSFNWKAIANDKGLAYVQASSIYSAKSGDPSKGSKTNYKWYDENDAAGYTPVYIPNEGYSNLMENVSNPNGVDTADDDALKGWNTYSATFTTIEDEEYYLFINFGLKGSIGDQTVIISDVVIEEVVEGTAPAADEMIEHPGVSIRKKGESVYGQALRYKFTIDGDVIANAMTDGYELTEYGTVVALADDIAPYAKDPIMNATKYTVKTGVAYKKAFGGTATTNIQFAVADNGDVTYTAALYNIPTANYSSSIAVRPYAVFTNAQGDSYIRYGTTRFASVFEVAKAVLEGDNNDDIAYVNNTLLTGDIKAAYDAWVNEQ